MRTVSVICKVKTVTEDADHFISFLRYILGIVFFTVELGRFFFFFFNSICSILLENENHNVFIFFILED